MNNVFKKMKSPVGELTLIACETGLCSILWEDEKENRVKINLGIEDQNNKILNQTQKELEEYFLGKRTEFTIPLNPIGTEFQKKVWMELRRIPFGKTISYLELATRIGNPKASRAVGGANGKNPLSIIVPCHRVIGSSGKLTGFAGGISNKTKLLELEQKAS